GVRRVEETLEVLGKPMVTARFAARVAHALLHDAPVAVGAHDERVQVELVTVLDRRRIDLRDEAARVRERVPGKPRSFADARELGRRASRLPSAAAADVDAELA